MAKAKINIFHFLRFLITVSWCIRGNLTSGLIDVVKSLLINNQVENAQLIESPKGIIEVFFDTFKNRRKTKWAGSYTRHFTL